MMTRLQDIEDIQGAFLRRILQGTALAPIVGALTPARVEEALAKYLPGRPGGPVPHESSASVALFVTHGKWKGLCPECSAGLTTGIGWARACCFECGAIVAVQWPADPEALARELLRRPVKYQHWRPGETLAALAAETKKILAKGMR